MTDPSSPFQVRVFRPAKTTMQSGRAGLKHWVIEYETATARRPEPLMGWSSSGDTLNQVRLRFATKDEALAFAAKKGWQVDLEEAEDRNVQPRTYLDNFKRR